MAKKQRATQISQGIVNLLYPITIMGLFTLTVLLPLLAGLYLLKVNLLTLLVLWVCLLPIGPMVTAIFASTREYVRTKTPGLYRQAWHFWRQHWREGLRLWAPFWLFLLPLMLYGQVSLAQAPRFLYVLIPAVLILGILAAVIATTVLLLAATFTFSYGDYFRLALGSLAQHLTILLADIVLVLVGACIGLWVSPLLLVVLTSCLLVPFYYLNQPLLDWIESRFVAR
ncbi:MAG: DUF624 domain-containing protein [Lactobacillus sp.]|jgi:uncharacterized membrane protein YesL|nr:DUF624 domain-containing protein [Lactobacillus sp.]MCI2031965.1 DUF624 domain-containing protein [Lactobacillus sp.]